jgi:periplasmic protein TonB
MKALSIALFDDRDRYDLLRWGLAGAVILAAHAGLIATYMLLRKPEAVSAGATVITLELAPAPAAPDVAPMDMRPEQTMEEAEQQPPEPQVTQPPVEEPPPPPVAKAEVVEPPPAPPEPVKKEVQPEPPKPKPKVEERKKPPAPKTTSGSKAQAKAQSASAPRVGAGGSSAISPDWKSLLVAHLHRNKRYPSGSQSQGTAVLSFTMDRGGRVLSRNIARSSGSSDLDAEVLAMIMRAQPLPAFPPSMTQARMTLTVPINFSLGR